MIDGRRELSYGGLQLEITPDGKSYRVRQDEGPARSSLLQPPLELKGDWHSYRLTARDGRVEIAVDGHPVHAARLPANADPWLSIRQLGRRAGGVRNLQITGRPEVPECLDLTSLSGWSSTYLGEPTPTSTASTEWNVVDGEIRGRRLAAASGRHQETVLQYRQPLWENGSIEYEFYACPGFTMAHPALDRRVFLLTTDGVRTHWLTDGRHDRSGLSTDNQTDEPASRRGPEHPPLRVGDWNRLRITLEVRRMTLTLNGVDIYESEVDPQSCRVFGIFHESDATEVRVRNIQYQGHWPRSLPDPDALMAVGR